MAQDIDSETKKLIQSSPAAKQWKILHLRHHHGINVPLFSIRTEQSAGIGEYLDLLPLVRWCKKIGLDVIQLLPLNDTGIDPSPYFALSANALNPLHLSLHALPNIDRSPELITKLNALQQLNHYPRIPNRLVLEKKMEWLHQYLSVDGKSILSDPEYSRFLDQQSWVHPYATFKLLRQLNHQRPWEEWDEELQSPTAETMAKVNKAHEDEINRYKQIQFLCFQQLKSVKDEATRHEVFLKGDIPILISRNSVDVWENPQYFSQNANAGCPPDMFNHHGQDWKFPTFRWEAIREDDFRWWRKRLQTASNFFHLYRLDHYVGFYRIWSIPRGATPHEGMFYPRDPETWVEHGESIMRMMLDTSEMLPIGEDLGVVPLMVRKNMKKLGICGTKVMRWERNWKTDWKFIEGNEYPPLTMSTVGTHDNESLQEWWEVHPDEALDYCRFQGWKVTPTLTKDQHKHLLLESHRTNSIFHINLLQEYMALFPELSWPLPQNDRVNIPGTQSDRNWSYKYRRNLETITNHQGLANLFSEMTQVPISRASKPLHV